MYDELIEALTIFSKYEHRAGFSAEHDVIYAGPPTQAVSPEDRTRLNELGWYDSDYGDCFQKFV